MLASFNWLKKIGDSKIKCIKVNTWISTGPKLKVDNPGITGISNFSIFKANQLMFKKIWFYLQLLLQEWTFHLLDPSLAKDWIIIIIISQIWKSYFSKSISVMSFALFFHLFSYLYLSWLSGFISERSVTWWKSSRSISFNQSS